jgi:uncharacterized protein DUF6221
VSDDRLVSAVRAAIGEARSDAMNAQIRHGEEWTARKAANGSVVSGTIENRTSGGCPETDLWDSEGGYLATSEAAGAHMARWDPVSVIRLCDAAEKMLDAAEDMSGERDELVQWFRENVIEQLASAFGVSTEGATE